MKNKSYKDIKLIFLDVDGVIAKNYMTPTSPEMLTALKKLGQKYHLSLCTGRSIQSAGHIIQGAELNNFYHVLETGSKVTAPGGDFEYEKSLSTDEIQKLIELTIPLGCFYGVCVNGEWIDDVNEVVEEEITILSINTKNKEQTRNVLDVIEPIRQNFHISTLVSSFCPTGSHIHITINEVSKGTGVRYVIEKLGLDKSETLGVGDSIGDWPMLDECGVKVVMGNADDDVKENADIVIGDFEDGGLIEFIKENLV